MSIQANSIVLLLSIVGFNLVSSGTQNTGPIVQDLKKALTKFNSLYESGQDIDIEYYTPIYSRAWQLDTQYQKEIQDLTSKLLDAGNDFHTTLVDGGSNDDTNAVNDKLQAIYLSIANVLGEIHRVLNYWNSNMVHTFWDQLHALAANNTLPAKQLSKQLTDKGRVSGQSILNNLLADKLALEESATVIDLQLSFIKHGQQMKDLLSEAKSDLNGYYIPLFDPLIQEVSDIVQSKSIAPGGQLAG